MTEVAHGEIGIEVNDRSAMADLKRVEGQFTRSMSKIDHQEASVNIKATLTELRKDLKQAERDVNAFEKKRANAATTYEKRSSAQMLANARKRQAALQAESAETARRANAVNTNIQRLGFEDKKLAAIQKRDKDIANARARAAAQQLRSDKQAIAAAARIAHEREHAALSSEREAVAVSSLQRQYVSLQHKQARINERRTVGQSAAIKQEIDLDEKGVVAKMALVRAKLHAMASKPIDIKVHTKLDLGPLKQFSNLLSSTAVRVGPFTTSLSSLILIMGLLGPALLSVAGAMVNLAAVTTGGLVGGLGLAGAAAFGLGLSLAGVVAVTVPFAKQMGKVTKESFGLGSALGSAKKGSDAAKQATKELHKYLGTLGPMQKKVAGNFAKVGRAFGELKRASKKNIWETFISASKAAANLAPMFKTRWAEAISVVAGGMQDWFARLGSKRGQSVLGNIMGDTNEALKPLLVGLGDVGAATGKVFESFSRHFPGIAETFKAWAEGLNNAANDTGGLNAKVDTLVGYAKSLGSFLWEAGGAIKALFGAAAPEGAETLRKMTDTAVAIQKWARSKDAKKFFEDARVGAEALWYAIKPFVSFFIEWARAMQPIGTVMLTLVGLFGRLVMLLDKLQVAGISAFDVIVWTLFAYKVKTILVIVGKLIGKFRELSRFKAPSAPNTGAWSKFANILRKIKMPKLGAIRLPKLPGWLGGNIVKTIKLKWGARPPLPRWLRVNILRTIKLKWGKMPRLPGWIRNPLSKIIKFKIPQVRFPPLLAKLLKNPVVRFALKALWFLNVALLLKDIFSAGVKAKDTFVKAMAEGKGIGGALIEAAKVFGDELGKAIDRFFGSIPGKLRKLLPNPLDSLPGSGLLSPPKPPKPPPPPPPAPKPLKPVPSLVGGGRGPVGMVSLAKPITQVVNFVAKKVGPAWKDAKTKVTKAVLFAATKVGELWRSAKAKVVKAVSFVASKVGELWRSAKAKVRKAVSFVASKVGALWRSAKDKVRKAVAFLASKAGTLWRSAKDKWRKVVDFVSKSVGALWRNAKSKWKKIIDFVSKAVGSLWKNAKAAWKKTINFVANKVGSLWRTATAPIRKVVNFVARKLGFAEGGITPGYAKGGVRGFASGGSNGDGPARRARRTTGGTFSRPSLLNGDGRYPEVVLATNPAYRDDNQLYWQAAGTMLKAPGFTGERMAERRDRADRIGDGVPGFARGSEERPQSYSNPFLVGEENRREYVLSMNPSFRSRNLSLWTDAASELGIPGFHSGGGSHRAEDGSRVPAGYYSKRRSPRRRSHRHHKHSSRRWSSGGSSSGHSSHGRDDRGERRIKGTPARPPMASFKNYAGGGADQEDNEASYTRAKEHYERNKHDKSARENWQRWRNIVLAGRKWNQRHERRTTKSSRLETQMNSPWNTEGQFRSFRRQRVDQLSQLIRDTEAAIRYSRARGDSSRVQTLTAELAQYRNDREETKHAERSRPDIRQLMTDGERRRIDSISADMALQAAGLKPRFGKNYGGGDPATQGMLFWNRLLNDKRFSGDPSYVQTIAGEIASFKGQSFQPSVERTNSDNARGELYKDYGSNFRWTGRDGADALRGDAMQRNPAGLIGSSDGAGQAVSEGYSGSSFNSGGGSSGGDGRTLNQTNNFLTQPQDPHTFAADVKFEVEGM